TDRCVVCLRKLRLPYRGFGQGQSCFTVAPGRAACKNRNLCINRVEMKPLKDILHGIPVRQVLGNLNVAVAQVCFDSRRVEPNSLFVAVRGTHTDGHRYVDEVGARGAVAILCEELPEKPQDEVTYIHVTDTAFALGISAAN